MTGFIKIGPGGFGEPTGSDVKGKVVDPDSGAQAHPTIPALIRNTSSNLSGPRSRAVAEGKRKPSKLRSDPSDQARKAESRLSDRHLFDTASGGSSELC